MSVQTSTTAINWNAISATPGPTKPAREKPEKPCPVLVTHQAGEIKIFGPANLRPMFINLPTVTGKESELALEKLTDEILPSSFHEIYFPGCLRGTGWIKTLTVAEFADQVELAKLDARLFAKTPWTGRQAMLGVMSR